MKEENKKKLFISFEDTLKQDWSKSKLVDLVDYIENHYHNSLIKKLAGLEELIDKVNEVHKARFDDNLSFLVMVFKSFRTELEEHTAKEEKILFPYIRELAGFSEGKLQKPLPPEGTMKNVIRYMERYEHENALKTLKDIRELTGDYSLPSFDCLIFPLLYEGLQKLEKDLSEHIYLENHVLFPEAIKFEENCDM